MPWGWELGKVTVELLFALATPTHVSGLSTYGSGREMNTPHTRLMHTLALPVVT